MLIKKVKESTKKLNNKLGRAKESAKKFKNELRKSIATAMVAAFGLVAALAWRDVISEWVNDLIVFSPVQGLLINALIITAISVIAIILITKYTSQSSG